MTEQSLKEFSVFLDANNHAGQKCGASVFEKPVAQVMACKTSEIDGALADLRRHVEAGYYAAGWISYEAGLYLEQKLRHLSDASYPTPFLCFGIFEKRQVLSAEESDLYWAEKAAADDYAVTKSRLSIDQGAYEMAVEKIKAYLVAGDIYQVNFTLKSLFDFSGSAESYFAALRRAQKVEYGAFIKTGDLSVLSLSPELFFDKRGEVITTRPMKGTCCRGRTVAEDDALVDFMKQDEKSRAENLMIVDLLRNDLSRIAQPGSVTLKSLYDVEKYRTLFQMTSTIAAKVTEDRDAVSVLASLFPCGSVTGAPKIRAMEIIAELEQAPRGIYTGAIGYMAPDGDCCFNVPIRTMTIDAEGRGEMGIGSAIVADSEAATEYEECLLKASFASRPFPSFELIESIGWNERDGFQMLDLHLDRLRQSARYFDFIFPEQTIRADLADHAAALDPKASWKVRLLLSARGEISLTATVITPTSPDIARTCSLSQNPVDSQNALLFHKTTDRAFYDRELKAHQGRFGSYDVLFVNEKGHLTEGAYNSLFIKRDGVLYTPPCGDGLLDGVLRRSLLEDSDVDLRIESLTLADLKSADEIYLGNSVRGLVKVSFLPEKS